MWLCKAKLISIERQNFKTKHTVICDNWSQKVLHGQHYGDWMCVDLKLWNET